jgi:hypothetical protein
MNRDKQQPQEDARTEQPAPRRARRSSEAAASSKQQGGDARHSADQLKKNQEHLGVGPDHRTNAMKKGRRGTFP